MPPARREKEEIMLFCRYCGARMKKDSKICPTCGKSNAPGKVAKERKKQRNKKIAIVTAAIVLAVAILVPTVYFTVKGILWLNRPNDVYYHDSYTATKEEVVAARDTVVATMGEHKLTSAQLQVFYWAQVYDVINYYASQNMLSFVMDLKTPLDQQIFDEETGMTWQQKFLEEALGTWKEYTLLAEKAQKEGFQLPEEQEEYLKNLESSLEESAKKAGYISVNNYLSVIMCPSCTFEDYAAYVRLYYTANTYLDQWQRDSEVTDAEMETYFSENENILKAQYGVTKDSGLLTSVRHILVRVEGGKTNEDGETVYSDEEWAAAKKEALALLDEWKAGKMTEDSFAALANKKSDDAQSGGLFVGINKSSQYPKNWLDWALHKDRTPGETGLVKTEAGYHVMYYVNSEEGWTYYSRNGIQATKAGEMVEKLLEENTLVTDYQQITLVFQDLSRLA